MWVVYQHKSSWFVIWENVVVASVIVLGAELRNSHKLLKSLTASDSKASVAICFFAILPNCLRDVRVV